MRREADRDRVLDQLANVRMLTVGGARSPHKLLLLLALARLYGRRPERENSFPLNDVLEAEFFRASVEYCGEEDASTILIEFPYGHLVSDGIWRLLPRDGKESLLSGYLDRTLGRLTHSRITATVAWAELAPEWDRCLRDAQSRPAVICAIEAILEKVISERNGAGMSSFPSLDLRQQFLGLCNPFVGYLNSLIRLSGGNENALAEFQALSPLFPLIHVQHPLSDRVVAELRSPGGRQVILTGHAGDGKSTIAVDVFRRLTGRSMDEPLTVAIHAREEVGDRISIIKDLSERHRANDSELTAQLLAGERRFLLVSNTGALLDLFRGQCAQCGLSATEVESAILSAVSAHGGEGELTLGGARFLVLNLARVDNLDIARQILARMLARDRWTACESKACRANCPIARNVDLMSRRGDVVLDRLFLAYRRMYEYGTRLTMRQITEHLAYLITSGLDEAELDGMRARPEKPLKAQYMFFNRFFGDDGKEEHAGALRMRAVQEVRRQGFGVRPCTTWERKLWLKFRDDTFRLGVEECDEEFDLLREHGSGPGTDSRPGLTPDQAREQVRRMLFFLYPFSDRDESYIRHFLNSPMIMRWSNWQLPNSTLGMNERASLEQRIYHVLQEHFSGVRLPEGKRARDLRLYITLSRRKSDLRQSAQVVIAQVDWSDDIELRLERRANVAGGSRTDLALRGRNRINGIVLEFTLPFLDYMVMRHLGEVGESLQAAYVQRLERFKAQVQAVAREPGSHVMLVRLKTDHTFRRQQYAVRDGRLEVE